MPEAFSENIQCNSLFFRETQCVRMTVAGAGVGRGGRRSHQGHVSGRCTAVTRILPSGLAALSSPPCFFTFGYHAPSFLWNPSDYGQCSISSTGQDTLPAVIYERKGGLPISLAQSLSTPLSYILCPWQSLVIQDSVFLKEVEIEIFVNKYT